MSHEKCPNCGRIKHQLNRCKCGFQRNKITISSRVLHANEQKRLRRLAAKKEKLYHQVNTKASEELRNLRKRVAQQGFHEGAKVPGSHIRKVDK